MAAGSNVPQDLKPRKKFKDRREFNAACKEESLDIGLRMQDARREAHLTQKQLAGMIGLSRSYISQLESGAVKVPAFAVKLYCDYLGVSAESLLDTQRPTIRSKSGSAIVDLLPRLPEKFLKYIHGLMVEYLFK